MCTERMPPERVQEFTFLLTHPNPRPTAARSGLRLQFRAPGAEGNFRLFKETAAGGHGQPPKQYRLIANHDRMVLPEDSLIDPHEPGQTTRMQALARQALKP
jgi:hypothetical protein